MPLTVVIPEMECYDETNNRFIYIKQQKLQLEHSLVSLSKWESKWNISYLFTDHKTREQTLDYIRCMTITQNVDPNVYICLPANIIKEINEYIEKPQTATTITSNRPKNKKGKKEIVTAELIYYWMFSYNISKECEKWHLSRLLRLIEVFSIKNDNSSNNKMSRKEILQQNKAMNEARKKAYNTKG